ncbi:MAG: CoA pyrophosphatase [Endozoicomonas sp. (ex Botrylloides leachii)]|nr:CoA pyrophosphatase [Endozoicomonas sp. (ex Botrylloides leachii)]
MFHRIQQRLSSHQPRSIKTKLPQAAVLLPVTNAPSPELIFTRRAMHLSTHAGEVSFPGGKYDHQDSSLETTALRESFEEINLYPTDVKILGRTGSVISRFGIEVTPYVGVIPADIKLKPNMQELDKIFRAPISFFLDSSNLRKDRKYINNQMIEMPSYHYKGYIIWGLTAIILTEFLNITLDACIPLDAPQFYSSFANNEL